MKLLLIALLCAISYAQTVNQINRNQTLQTQQWLYPTLVGLGVGTIVVLFGFLLWTVFEGFTVCSMTRREADKLLIYDPTKNIFLPPVEHRRLWRPISPEVTDLYGEGPFGGKWEGNSLDLSYWENLDVDNTDRWGRRIVSYPRVMKPATEMTFETDKKKKFRWWHKRNSSSSVIMPERQYSSCRIIDIDMNFKPPENDFSSKIKGFGGGIFDKKERNGQTKSDVLCACCCPCTGLNRKSKKSDANFAWSQGYPYEHDVFTGSSSAFMERVLFRAQMGGMCLWCLMCGACTFLPAIFLIILCVNRGEDYLANDVFPAGVTECSSDKWDAIIPWEVVAIKSVTSSFQLIFILIKESYHYFKKTTGEKFGGALKMILPCFKHRITRLEFINTFSDEASPIFWIGFIFLLWSYYSFFAQVIKDWSIFGEVVKDFDYSGFGNLACLQLILLNSPNLTKCLVNLNAVIFVVGSAKLLENEDDSKFVKIANKLKYFYFAITISYLFAWTLPCNLVFGSTSWFIYAWIFAALGVGAYVMKNSLVYFGCLEKYEDEEGVQYTTSESCIQALAVPFNSCSFEHGAFEESCAGKIFTFFAILFGSILIVILATLYLAFNVFLFIVLYTYVSNAGAHYFAGTNYIEALKISWTERDSLSDWMNHKFKGNWFDQLIGASALL